MPKRLTLSVISSQRDSLGANYTHTFGQAAGSIGRDQACEWHLPDTAVSRRHCTVRLLNDTFFLEDSSTNGTFVGGTEEANRLVEGQPRPLRNGDRIFIGDYELVAALEDDADTGGSGNRGRIDEATELDSGPADVEPPETESQVHGAEVPPQPPPGEPPAPSTPAGSGVSGETDPLKLLQPGAGSPPPSQPKSAPREEIPRGSDWNEPMPPLSPAAPSSEGGGQQIPPDWWKEPAKPDPEPEAEPTPEPRREPPRARQPVAAAGADDEMMRAMVAGLMEVLNARAEIKRRFRVSMTMIQARENNPLKFAVDTDEAMAKLFGSVSSGYLGPSESFEEAFRDLKAHQLAMLAGMREAFNKMLKQFDPHRLEVRFEKTIGKGKLPFLRDRHWELYKELYDELTADAEDSFHQLFGNAFAAAYEREMQRLIRELKRGE